MFLLHYQAFDSLGRSVAVYDEWDTSVVVSSGISYQGKTNVVSYKTNSYRVGTSKEAVVYYNYESNGDISHFVAPDGYPGNRSGWETIPLASEGTASFAIHDSSFTDLMGTHHAGLHTDQWSYTGVDSVNEAGMSFNAISFLFNQYSDGQPSPYPETDWWAPSLGIMIKSLEVDTEPQADGAVRFTDDLVSYTLK